MSDVRSDSAGDRGVEGRGAFAVWATDLVLGIRLAVGGGRISRTGVVRLLLSAVGIGLAVTVLLVAAAAGPAIDSHRERTNGMLQVHEPRPGVDPLHVYPMFTEYRGEVLRVSHVYVGGPAAPVPPGLARLPGEGEVVLSPALAELLAGPGGELLRPRFPGRVIGTIGQAGLAAPHDLRAFVGAGPELADEDMSPVYAFGTPRQDRELPPNLLLVLWVGVAALLVPMFIFVATASRIAGAERDRRLAALRLSGADVAQVRRIAAAESLVGAVAGLAFGVALFLLLRSSAANVEVLGEGFFPDDLTPSPVLAALVLLAVPALAVLTAQFALRNTIVEPLGVVRRSRPVRRRLHWRLAIVVLGVGMLFIVDTMDGDAESGLFAAVGAGLLLAGVPALLPWLLEGVINRGRGGGHPSFVLAVRRLQLDSGTPARVVGGIAAVLTGAIALQALLVSQADGHRPDALPHTDAPPDSPAALVVDDESMDAVLAAVRGVPGVTKAYAARFYLITTGEDTRLSLGVMSCADLRMVLVLTDCQDGQVFHLNEQMTHRSAPTGSPVVDEQAQRGLRPGAVVTIQDYVGRTGDRVPAGTFRLPGTMPSADRRPGLDHLYVDVVATPGAMSGVRLPEPMMTAGHVWTEPGKPDLIEHIRNALAPLKWRAAVSGPSGPTESQRTFATVRTGLLIGALFTLTLAGMSMLVLALEQMRERRRAIAALSATGVPISTLARSVLWQTAIPVLFAVGLAVAAGVLLAALVLRLSDTPFAVDWTSMALMSGTAVVLVLLVTALTLPSLRGAARLNALRTE